MLTIEIFGYAGRFLDKLVRLLQGCVFPELFPRPFCCTRKRTRIIVFKVFHVQRRPFAVACVEQPFRCIQRVPQVFNALLGCINAPVVSAQRVIALYRLISACDSVCGHQPFRRAVQITLCPCAVVDAVLEVSREVAQTKHRVRARRQERHGACAASDKVRNLLSAVRRVRHHPEKRLVEDFDFARASVVMPYRDDVLPVRAALIGIGTNQITEFPVQRVKLRRLVRLCIGFDFVRDFTETLVGVQQHFELLRRLIGHVLPHNPPDHLKHAVHRVQDQFGASLRLTNGEAGFFCLLKRKIAVLDAICRRIIRVDALKIFPSRFIQSAA